MTSLMRAMVLDAPGQVRLRDVARPSPGRGEVLIRTAAVGLCATDLEMIDGRPRVRPPAILGHEWCGTVEQVGAEVDRRWLGALIVGENVLPCGTCAPCQHGIGPCEAPVEVGFERPGAYGEFFTTRAASLHRLPEGFPAEVGVLVEPLAVCFHALDRVAVEEGAVVVFGDGPIGLLVAHLLKRRGREVVVVGGYDERLAVAKALGATATMNFRTVGDVVETIRSTAECRLAIEASGSAEAFHAALDVLPPRGQLIMVGDYGEARADFLLNRVLLNEIAIAGSNASGGGWPRAVQAAIADAGAIARLITHRFRPDQIAEAITAVRRRGALIKAVVTWQ